MKELIKILKLMFKAVEQGNEEFCDWFEKYQFRIEQIIDELEE